MLRIHSVESFATHDGPGIRLVYFLQGCNFACSYCANVDTIALEGGKMTDIEEMVNQAVNQKQFFGKKGGVTISGGEPLLQAKQIIPLFEQLHKAQINTCIDTNGSVLNNHVRELLTHTDLILLDVKHIESSQHFKITQKENKPTLTFAEYLKKENIPFWLRYVLVPGLSDSPEHLHALGQHFENYNNIEKLEIQPYHSLGIHKYEHMGLTYKLKGVKENTKEQLDTAYAIFSQYFKKVIIN